MVNVKNTARSVDINVGNQCKYLRYRDFKKNDIRVCIKAIAISK